ncbi:MAG: PLP-dependent aminotransferase family protein [Lautropia sp.]
MPHPRPFQWAQLFALSDRQALPLQARLRSSIVQAILDQRLDGGARLPSSRELAALLGLSRNTVNAAYLQLIDDGYLEARPRSGVFVAAQARPPAVGATLPSPDRLATNDPQPVAPPGPDWARRVLRSLADRPMLSKPQRWRDHAYPFVYGTYDAELFPCEDFRECCARSLARAQLPHWTPDFETDDVPDLIEQIRTRLLPKRGVFALKDEILVTLGAQHAYYLLSETLLDERIRLGIEEPGHPHARHSFALRCPQWVSLPVDGDGVIVDSLPEFDYAFVTPSHQSPTTVTLPLARRQQLLRHVEQHDAIVIEDDYEAENLYAGTPLPALKSLDRSGRVIYVGSVSKDLSPALRLGFIVAPQAVIGELRLIRHAMLRHPSAFLQHAYALFVSLGHHDSHARRVNKAMRERVDAAARALAEYLPDFAFRSPQGGASIWVEAPPWVDAAELAVMARARSVLIEAGDVFFAQPPYPCRYFRLRLSSIPTAQIDAGIHALSLAVADLAAARGGIRKPDAAARARVIRR